MDYYAAATSSIKSKWQNKLEPSRRKTEMFENISIRKYAGPFTSRKKQAEQYTPEEGAKREVGLAKLFVLHL